MKVTVHFADGERIEGDSAALSLMQMGFPVVPSSGNNSLVWVSLSAIKYVLIHAGNMEASKDGDPRARRGLPKIVIRFKDGEVIRTYRDENWGAEGDGFKLRIWDSKLGVLIPALVSLHHVKGIFFVKQWDSRSSEEKLLTPAGGRGIPSDLGPAPWPKTAPRRLTRWRERIEGALLGYAIRGWPARSRRNLPLRFDSTWCCFLPRTAGGSRMPSCSSSVT